ncbi:MAG: hypothetical protein B7Z75_01280 [Acidocella sp. 20-57-95]|nr:MAG: hypothetical protein B7Z75_01280 [Acidocella sp. 20-57-95]OYV61019.1 MAG: hypothetical protein B7Z71_05300 [Acidocella sp. 21-58-7]HQT65090.1 YcgN family cysteine cluster protein [Acidocella sp.]HQU04502.1 YcgN family cysteine cluster protein [Acidocella sp.]
MTKTDAFWRVKSLVEMTKAEWESLCDGCGRCCLHKLRDEDTDEISFTNVACRLLELGTGRCSDYANRRKRVPDCVQLTPAKLKTVDWLPPSCAYRLLGEGKDLFDWHPLISGDPESVKAAGISVAGRALSERDAGPLEHHLVEWPGELPKRKRVRAA